MASSVPCYYCASEEHRLDMCNNDRLMNDITNVFQLYFTYCCDTENPNINGFHNALRRNFNSKELKSICIRHLGGRDGLTKQQYIIHIEDSMKLLISYTNIVMESSSPPSIYDFMQQYMNNNPDQIQDISVVSSSSQVYNYSIIPKSLKTEFNLDVIYNSNKNNNIITCPICLEDNIGITNKIQLNCNHEYCFDCVTKVITNKNSNTKPTCSLCRTNITILCVQEECQELFNNLNKLIS